MIYLVPLLSGLTKSLGSLARTEDGDSNVKVPSLCLPVLEIPQVIRESLAAGNITISDSTFRQIQFAGVVGSLVSVSLTLKRGVWRIGHQLMYQCRNAANRDTQIFNIIIQDQLASYQYYAITGISSLAIQQSIDFERTVNFDRDTIWIYQIPSLTAGDVSQINGSVFFNKLL